MVLAASLGASSGPYAGSSTIARDVTSGVCVGAQVAADANLVTVANANAAGSTFCLAAGQYKLTGTGIPLQSGDRWVGALGAQGQRLSILDGGDSATRAFTCTCSGGQIVNVIIEDFANPVQQAPTGPALTFWLFDNVESRENLGIGLFANDDTTVRNSFIHHNRQLGVAGQGARQLWEDNEISFNNYLGANDPEFEAGGSKWVNAVDLTVRGNYVHDNCGPGLWTDHKNSNVRYENNRLEDNAGSGVRHEISLSATMIGNTITNNAHGTLGSGGPTCRAGYSGSIGGINIASSGPNIEIANNIVANNDHGIVAQQSNPDFEVQNLNVHDNDVTMTVGWSGFRWVSGPTGNTNIRFENNDYHVPNTSSGWWHWLGETKTWTQWQSIGFDDTGSRSIVQTNERRTNLFNIIGLTFDIVGVVLVWKYGIPEHLSLVGHSHLILEQTNEAEMKRAARYDSWSVVALGFIVFGFLMQIVGNLLG